jgi:hypothetical protein
MGRLHSDEAQDVLTACSGRGAGLLAYELQQHTPQVPLSHFIKAVDVV